MCLTILKHCQYRFNTSKLYRMEQFVDNFPKQEAHLTGEEIHRRLDEIELFTHSTPLPNLVSPLHSHVVLSRSCWVVVRLNGSRLYRSRYWKCDPHQTDQTPLYVIFKYCSINLCRLSDLYRMSASGRNVIPYSVLPRGRIYLFHAVYHTGISVYYKRHRPCETGFAFRT